MKDYEPEYVYMIPLAHKKQELYYENISSVPAYVRGAFLTDDDKKDKVDFEVLINQVVARSIRSYHLSEFH